MAFFRYASSPRRGLSAEVEYDPDTLQILGLWLKGKAAHAMNARAGEMIAENVDALTQGDTKLVDRSRDPPPRRLFMREIVNDGGDTVIDLPEDFPTRTEFIP